LFSARFAFAILDVTSLLPPARSGARGATERASPGSGKYKAKKSGAKNQEISSYVFAPDVFA
jgi:hypothetical protein